MNVTPCIGTDLAFLLAKEFAQCKSETSIRSKVGLVLTYTKAASSKIIKEILDKGWKDRYTLITFESLIDEPLIEIARDNGMQVLSWKPHEVSITDFAHELGSFECLVSNRFHGCISAAMLSVPFIAITDDQKLASLEELFPNIFYGALSDDYIIKAIGDEMRLLSHLKNEDFENDLKLNQEKLKRMYSIGFSGA
jgi:polysaccharide pyruvyl transferase WcaK-like protein